MGHTIDFVVFHGLDFSVPGYSIVNLMFCSPVFMISFLHIPLIEEPAGYFIVEFVEICKSRYAHTYSFCCGRLQEDILCSRLHDEPQLMQHYCELQDGTPYRIYNQNPIDLGFALSTIKQGGMLYMEVRAVFSFFTKLGPP